MDTPPIQFMPNFEIDCSGVLKLLKQLNQHKACEPDEIPVYIMKECAEELTPALTRIYTISQ